MNTTPTASPLLTAEEAAAHLRVSVFYVRRHKAEIGHVGHARRLLFTLADLEAFRARHHHPAQVPVPETTPRAIRMTPRREGINPFTKLPWGEYDEGVAR